MGGRGKSGGCTPRAPRLFGPCTQEIIREDFLKPLDLWGVIEETQPVTPERAGRLVQVFGASSQFWMGLQARYDKRAK